MIEGVVYELKKKSSKGSWVEYYVKIRASDARRLGLKHKQRVWVSLEKPSNPGGKLQELLTQLFLRCFRDPKLAKAIVSDPERASLVKQIIQLIKGGEKP